MNVKRLVKAVAGAVLVASGMGAGSANAFVLFPNTILQDDDREYFIDVKKEDGSAGNDGLLSVGDRLRATIEIAAIENGSGPGSYALSTGGQAELTGISEVEVLSKTLTSGVAGTASARYDIVFGPSAAFVLELAGMGIAVTGFEMAAFWKDATPDLDLTTCASVATCEANAKNGVIWATAGTGYGLGGTDPDGYWVATDARDNIASVKSISGGTKVGVFNYALDVLYNNTGYSLLDQDMGDLCTPNGEAPCPGDKKIQVIGSGDVLGGAGLTNGYDARSDFDFTLKVPEPESLALLGIAALGLGFFSRRKAA